MNLYSRWVRRFDTHLGGRRDFAFFAGSTVIYQASRFAFSIGAARSLEPGEFTTWTLVVAFLVYAPSLSLGVMNGAGRELPLLIGLGRRDEAQKVAAESWGAGLIAGALTVAAGVCLAILGVRSVPTIAGLLGAGTIIYAIQQMVFRSTLQFTQASVQQTAFGAFALGATLGITFAGNATVFTVAVAYLCVVGGAIVIGMVSRRPPVPRFTFGRQRALAGIGFPIMLAGLLFSVFITLDRWMAAAIMGPEGAAPYALASLASAALLVIPTVVSQQTYPRMALALGAGASTESVRAMAREQGILGAALTIPIAVVIMLLAVFALPTALPAYAAASTPIVVLCIGLVALTSMTGYGNYLNVVGGQWRYLAVQALGVLSAVPAIWVLGGQLGANGIAMGMLVGEAVYGILLREVALRTAPRSIRLVGRMSA